MSFLENLRRAKAFLEEQQRVSLRGLARELGMDGEPLDELVEELVETQKVAERDGTVLVWRDGPPPPKPRATSAPSAERARGGYTPKHLADEILRSRSALEGERKQVTVMFADVKGSMELAEQLDAEAWHAILDRFFRILAEGVHRFEGTINQYTGDGIMALFGAPIAHEDHAQRACYAALRISERLREYADELRLERGLSFAVRIGINTGEAVVGKIGDDLRMDYTAQGQTVGLAQRMEQLAEPGRCYLTEDTARLVEGYFVLRYLGDAQIEGASGPLGIHELEAVGAIRTRFDAARSRGLSGFVGRGDEMAQLEEALERASAGAGQVVTVVGDAGVGKSRLCFEFAQRCRARGIPVSESAAVAHGASRPLLPVVEMVRRLFEIGGDDREIVARRKIAGALLLLDPDFQEDLGLIFDLLGVADPDRPTPELDPQMRERRIRRALVRLFRLWGGSRPGVILLEDLHWLDAGSEAILRDLVQAIAETPKVLLLNYRPEYGASWIPEQTTTSRSVSLAALGPSEVRRLVEENLGSDESIRGLMDRIADQAGGNPFFAEEAVRALADANVLIGVRGSYRTEGAVEKLSVPATVQATIASRIDRLEDADKETLQVASVIGAAFSHSLLGQVRGLDEERLAHSLQRLVEHEFIDLEALYPERGYAFRHALTRDVAYESPLSEFRKRTHLAVARAIEERHEHVDDVAAVIARHLEAGGEALDAARWYARAARRQTRVNVAAAMDHWSSVRRVLSECESNEETAALLVEAGIGVLSWATVLGLPREELRAIVEEARAEARRLGDPSSEIHLLVSYNTNLITLGAAGESVSELEEAVRLASRGASRLVHARALMSLAVARMTVGSLAAGSESMKECVGILEAASSEDPVRSIMMYTVGSAALVYDGRLTEAERALSLADRLTEEHALPWRRNSARSLVAAVAGRAEQAVEAARRGVVGTTSPFDVVLSHGALAGALVAVGRFEEALEHVHVALETIREDQVSMHLLPLHLGFEADAHVGLGQLDEARQAAEEGVRIAVSSGAGLHQCHARLSLLRVLAAQRAFDQWEREIERVESLIDRIEGHRYFDPRLHEERARLAEIRGERMSWRRELGEAARLHEAIGADGHVERLRVMLGDYGSETRRQV